MGEETLDGIVWFTGVVGAGFRGESDRSTTALIWMNKG